jgi:hypothetical protein
MLPTGMLMLDGNAYLWEEWDDTGVAVSPISGLEKDSYLPRYDPGRTHLLRIHGLLDSQLPQTSNIQHKSKKKAGTHQSPGTV